MKNFKKMFVLILACVLIVSLTACNIRNNDNQDKQEKPTTSVDVTNPSDDNDITGPTVTEPEVTQPVETEPSESAETTNPTESETQPTEDVMSSYIPYDDFGKDNDYFQEVLNNMRNYTGTIVVRNPDLPNIYSKVDYQNKWVLNYEYSLTFFVHYVTDSYGHLGLLGKDETTETDVPIDYYAGITKLAKYDYVKIGNVLYGAEKSVLDSCHLIKIYLNENGLIQSYVTSPCVRYEEWDKNWDNSELFNIDEAKYEYLTSSLTELS